LPPTFLPFASLCSSYLFILSSHLCPAHFAFLLLPFSSSASFLPFPSRPCSYAMPCPASSIFSRTSLFLLILLCLLSPYFSTPTSPFPWPLPCSSHRSIHIVLPFHSCPTVILMFHLFYSCLQSTLSSISTAATVLLPFNPNAGKWFQVHTRQATVFDIKLATPRRLGGLLANAYAVFLSIHTITHFTRVTCAGIYRKVVGSMIL